MGNTSKKYTEIQTIERVKTALNYPQTLYAQAFINWSGETADTKRKYTEVMAEYLLENLAELKMPVLIRESSYKTEEHDGKTENNMSNRTEERIALAMFGKTYDHIGEVLDYQVPLKNAKANKGIGKIDLLSFGGKHLYILELKKLDSVETLLRCVLEAYTYYRTVDSPKLLHDFTLPDNTIVKKAALVFADKFAHLQYNLSSR